SRAALPRVRRRRAHARARPWHGRAEGASLVSIVARLLLAVSLVFVLPVAGSAAGDSPLRPARGWCEARPNAAWRAALEHGVVPLSRTASVVPIAPARDSRTFFAEIWSSSFSGVARIDARTSSVTPIKEFTDPVNDQALGNFDGRWLVWR